MKFTYSALALLAIFTSAYASCPSINAVELTSWPNGDGQTAHQIQLTFNDSGCSPNSYSNFIIKVHPSDLTVIGSWNLGSNLGGGLYNLDSWVTTGNWNGGYTYLGNNVPSFSLYSYYDPSNPTAEKKVMADNQTPRGASCVSINAHEQASWPANGDIAHQIALTMDVSKCPSSPICQLKIKIHPDSLTSIGSWNLGTHLGGGIYELPDWARAASWNGGYTYLGAVVPNFSIQYASFDCPW